MPSRTVPSAAWRVTLRLTTPEVWCSADTSSVSGLFNTIAQALLPANASLYDTALLFARLNVAGFDGVSGAWRVKYRALSWRPVTAIR